MTTTTTNMNLELPDVSSTLGPAWAQILNEALQTVDEHDHSTGNGVKITPSGLNINSDLDIQDNDILRVLTMQLKNQNSADTTKAGTVQRVGTNLYWVNSAGTAVQITNGSSVVSTGSGVLSVSVPGAYPYAVLTSDAQAVLLIDSSAARTLTLPAATNIMTVYVKDALGSAGSNTITITPDGTDAIDGVNTSYTLQSNYGCVGFISDGSSNWYVI
jgi:hypothetical protein